MAAIARKARDGLKRLCRYIARPSLEQVSEENYKLTLKTSWADGIGSVLLMCTEILKM